jgi:hypothetical protein
VTEQDKTLAKLIAQKFIARPDVMARQSKFGTYAPVHSKFNMESLLAHITGQTSLGHYMIDPDGDQVKLFALDIDLEKPNPQRPHMRYLLPARQDEHTQFLDWQESNPRQLWMSREQGAARNCIKLQMRTMAGRLVSAIRKELEIPAIAAYSGSKGIHVYGFTGKVPAAMAREGALIVATAAGWNLTRGQNFFTHGLPDADVPFGDYNLHDFHQYSLEIYPKQESVGDKEKKLGNLMRLPLGVNYKSPRDRAFFIDLRSALSELKPMDPIEALTTTNPWAFPHEL